MRGGEVLINERIEEKDGTVGKEGKLMAPILSEPGRAAVFRGISGTKRFVQEACCAVLHTTWSV
jgi:hypothetical protein